MGKYDSNFVTAKDGLFESSLRHRGGQKGIDRDVLFASRGLLGPGFSISFGYLDHTFAMKEEPGWLDYEHILGFIGADLKNMADFDAEIEFTLGGEKHVIKETTLVRVPAYVQDGPIVIKRVGKPFLFCHIFFTAHWHSPGVPEIAGIDPNPNISNIKA
jgi:hypothetical protein